MAILTTPSKAVPIALVYITAGTLIDVWCVVALWYYPPDTAWGKFLLAGTLMSGLALLVIGLLLGPIGRAARHAELPPTEVTAAAAQVEQEAAEHPPAVIAGAGIAAVPPAGTPGMTPPVAGTPLA